MEMAPLSFTPAWKGLSCGYWNLAFGRIVQRQDIPSVSENAQRISAIHHSGGISISALSQSDPPRWQRLRAAVCDKHRQKRDTIRHNLRHNGRQNHVPENAIYSWFYYISGWWRRRESNKSNQPNPNPLIFNLSLCSPHLPHGKCV